MNSAAPQLARKPAVSAGIPRTTASLGTLQRKCACGGSSGSSGGECASCKKKKQPLQRSAAGSEGHATAPPIVHDVLHSPGQPLDKGTRSYMEPRFGHDFGKVRLHTDATAAESARSVNAHAYTVGNRIAFASGKYSPQSSSGMRLLAHELAHVVQQSGSTAQAGVARSANGGDATPLAIASSDNASERAANSAADSVMGGSLSVNAGSAPAGLARDPAGPPKPPPAAPACDAAKQSDRASACIQPVVVADDDGKNPTSATSIATAQSIWAKCCIDLTQTGGKVINKSSLKTINKPSLAVSPDQTSLYNAAGSSTCIQAIFIQQFTDGVTTGKDLFGGAATSFGGSANPKIAIVEGADGAVLAHEIGHAMGHREHDANPTVMKPTGHFNVPNAAAVSADVCTKAKTGAAVTKAGGAKDCCMSF